MRKYCFLTLLVLLLLYPVRSSAAGLLEKDMAAFDKAYIPALALTSQGDKAAAQKAVEIMLEQWAGFKKIHSAAFNDNPADNADFATIDRLLAEAARTVQRNGKLDDAHEILEGVRITFLAFRERKAIDYYLDYTTRFHESMEAIVLTVKGQTPDTLTEAMVSKIKTLLKIAQKDWKSLQTAAFDPDLFSFSAEQDSRRQYYINAETEQMNRLQKALEQNDRGKIIEAARGIKPNFVNLFLLFGDFARLK